MTTKTVRMTSYLLADSEIPRSWRDAAPSANIVSVNIIGMGIMTFCERFLKAVKLEGFGRTPEGMIQYDLSHMSPTFRVADPEAGVWGLDARQMQLKPWFSVAVDPGLVKVGTRMKIHELVGKHLPNGRTHDGMVRAVDVGEAIDGHHMDLFVGTIDNETWMQINITDLVSVDILS